MSISSIVPFVAVAAAVLVAAGIAYGWSRSSLAQSRVASSIVVFVALVAVLALWILVAVCPWPEPKIRGPFYSPKKPVPKWLIPK
jgi:hypothetical protein